MGRSKRLAHPQLLLIPDVQTEMIGILDVNTCVGHALEETMLYFLSTWLFQELTGYSENNDQYFETAGTADSLRRFETHYNAK